MGSRNKPGVYDCYHNAEPDEPMFVLLGRDPSAAGLVRLWAGIRIALGEDPAVVAEALECATALENWAERRPEKVAKFAQMCEGLNRAFELIEAARKK